MPRAGRFFARCSPTRLSPTPHPPTKPFDELIDAKAVARRLKVPTSWVFAQARARRIPHHRLGHYVRFDPEDIERWLRARKITTPPVT